MWSLATYGYDHYRIFPRLLAISPERRCGKTTLLEVVAALCRNSIQASNLTPAIISRIKSIVCDPTLLIDEADTFIKNADGNIKGLINSGHTKSGAQVLKCVGDSHTPQVFDTWHPMVIASIGALEDTIMDRSVIINLRRKRPSENVQRLPSDLSGEWKDWRSKALRWFMDNASTLNDSNQIEPEYRGNDRAVDNWVPLFTLAKAVNDTWYSRCEAAYAELVNEVEMELPTLLLSDIRSHVVKTTNTRISSSSMVQSLLADETAPWADMRLTPARVASMLAPYNIKPKDMRIGGKVLRGYESTQFEDAFERYLPPI
ncbi:DUF3631 domain-containing protein [Oceanospirillaceae bacterium]|nr:DUF3631 domain-containing protein [Oceanospirillaceae bacterium]